MISSCRFCCQSRIPWPKDVSWENLTVELKALRQLPVPVLCHSAGSHLANGQSPVTGEGRATCTVIVIEARSNELVTGARSNELITVASDLLSQLYLALMMFAVPKSAHVCKKSFPM